MRVRAARVLPGLDERYVEAFAEVVRRIQASIGEDVSKEQLPITMYVAGGAAEFFYTGTRVSLDIDATFSRRILLPDNLEVFYKDSEGTPRCLHIDRQYNESFALLHENVHADSLPLRLAGVDPAVVDVRLFAPVDLAVSKLARFAEHDQSDIRELARRRLIGQGQLRKRAEEALGGYVGNLERVRTSIKLACDMVAIEERLLRTGPA